MGCIVAKLKVRVIEWYINPSWVYFMIEDFRDGWLRRFFLDDVRIPSIPVDIEARLFRKLQMIDDATCDKDLRVPMSNHFEKLRGDLAGFHSIRVNKKWRIIFRWDASHGKASQLYLDDHSYD